MQLADSDICLWHGQLQPPFTCRMHAGKMSAATVQLLRQSRRICREPAPVQNDYSDLGRWAESSRCWNEGGRTLCCYPHTPSTRRASEQGPLCRLAPSQGAPITLQNCLSNLRSATKVGDSDGASILVAAPSVAL